VETAACWISILAAVAGMLLILRQLEPWPPQSLPLLQYRQALAPAHRNTYRPSHVRMVGRAFIRKLPGGRMELAGSGFAVCLGRLHRSEIRTANSAGSLKRFRRTMSYFCPAIPHEWSCNVMLSRSSWSVPGCCCSAMLR
jgi:hypothetical protein